MVLNCQTSAPSRALKARTEPGNAPADSLVEKPRIIRSSNTTPGTVTERDPVRSPLGVRSSRPLSPKPSIGVPSDASNASSSRPAV